MNRKTMTTLAVAAALGACGGGAELLAVLPIVGPIGGSWNEDANPATVEQDPVADGIRFSAESDDPANYPAASRYTVSGRMFAPSGPCASPNGVDEVDITGEVDADRLVLRQGGTECLRAKFLDIRTLELADGSKRFRNGTPRIDLRTQVWVDAADASRRFTFTQGAFVGDDVTDTIAGCRGSGASAVTVSGTIAGFDTATKIGPEVPLLRVGTTDFTRGRFNGASEIEFGPNGGPALTLRRTLDKPLAGTCP